MASKQQFQNWMRMSGLSAATIQKYSEDTPNNLEVQNVLSRLSGTANMYNCTASQIRSAITVVLAMEFDIIGNKMYSAGLKKYLSFLSLIKPSLTHIPASLDPLTIPGAQPVDMLYLVRKLQCIVITAGLQSIALPSVFSTDENPPALDLYPDFENDPGSHIEEGADTEMLLGAYFPDCEKIVLYKKGISLVAKFFRCSESKLLEIVLVHELGHYMQHRMPCYTTNEWETSIYKDSYDPIDLHEAWAQLMDMWVVQGDNDKEYEQIFSRLWHCQSSPYRTFLDFTKNRFPSISMVDYSHKLLSSNDSLRVITPKASIEDWKLILGV